MSHRRQSQHEGEFFDSEDSAQSHSGEHSPLKFVLRELRGRYRLTGVLCSVLAILFAIAGYKATKPMFTSEGIIRIARTNTVILYENELNESLKRDSFDAFMQSQMLLMGSERTIEQALDTEQLKGSTWPSRPTGAEMLRSSLSIQNPRKSELVYISITHRSADLAHRAINGVLDAYLQIAWDKAAEASGNLEQELVNLRNEYQREQDNAREQASRLAESYGTSDLEVDLKAKRGELARLDTLVNTLQLNASIFPTGTAAASETVPSDAIGINDLARYDESLGRLVEHREQLNLQRDSLLAAGMKSGHRSMKRVLSEIGISTRYIEQRAQEMREDIRSGSLVLPQGGSDELYSQQQVLQQLASAKELRDQLAQEIFQRGQTQVRINYYTDRANEFAHRRDGAEERLETFRVEGRSKKIGRMELVQRGILPSSPSVDRRKPLAMVGFLGGVGLGVVSVLGFSIARPKYRHIEDISTEQGDYILGMLPDLENEQAGIAEIASANIHRIRGVLDAQGDRATDRASVHTILSATAGEGKTNLAFGLAASFAKTGKRTLLIDADLVAPSVSAELGLENEEGLAQAIEHRAVNGAICQTATPNFYVLPAGVKPADQSSHDAADVVSRHNLKRLIDEIAPQFDEIIIDTGPLLGSIEAVACASVADGVIFVVGRGQKPARVHSAIDHLRMLGVHRIGLVFNRAKTSDLMRSSVSGMSQHSMSVMRDPGHLTTPTMRFIQDSSSASVKKNSRDTDG